MSGASVCPRKMLPAVLRLSAPLRRMVRFRAQARAYTTFWMMPR